MMDEPNYPLTVAATRVPPPIHTTRPDRRFGAPPPDLFNFAQWFSVFRRRLPIFVIVAFVIFVGAVVLTLMTPPVYTASTSVMIETRQAQVLTNNMTVNQGLQQSTNDASQLDTQVELLKSKELTRRVVKELKLDQDPEFNPTLAQPQGVSRIVGFLTGLTSRASPDSAVDQDDTYVQDLVVSAVNNRLSVERSGLTFLLRVNFTALDPEKAAKISNAFAQAFLVRQLETKNDNTGQANAWLSGKLEELRGQVQAADAEVERYKIANNLMSASGSTLTEQEISSYNQQMAGARAATAEAQARLATARNQLARGASGEALGEALTSSTIQALRAQRAAVSGRVADLQGRYGPRHPDMLKAQRELDDIDGQIKSEIGRIVSNLESQAAVARQRQGSLQASLSSAQGSLATNTRAGVRLRELQRDADAVRAVYESYLNRFKETSAQRGLEQPDARIVTAATPPLEKSAPKTTLNLAIGLLLGVVSGLAAIALLELLDSSLSTGDEVERKLMVPYMGGVPLAESASGKPVEPTSHVTAKPLSVFAEAFRGLYASLIYSSADQPVKVVAVTSALPGEGKTTTSICLAHCVSLQGYKVVVVDCDLRRASLTSAIRNNTGQAGLLEVLSGQATLEQALFHDKSQAAFLPLRGASDMPADVFGSESMNALLEKLRARFDLVILDTAPVLAVTDTRTLARKADAVLMLAQWRRTPVKAIEAALHLLETADAKVAGVALTRVNLKQQAASGYGDATHYYPKYAKYYAN